MTHYCYHYYHHNHYHHYVTTTTTTTTIYFYRYFYFPDPQANGRNIVGQQLSTLLEVVKSFCTYLKFLSAFKFFATNPKKHTATCKNGVQTDATCNTQQCWELLANNAASVCTRLEVIIGRAHDLLLQLLLPPPQLPISLFFLLLTFEPIDLMESQKSDNNSSNNNCLAKWKLTILINPF